MIQLIFFLIAFNLNTDISLEEATKNSTSGDYETSSIILDFLNPQHHQLGRFYFLKTTNAHAIGDKEQTIKWGKLFQDSFDYNQFPIRHQHLVWIMLDDVSHWNDGDVGDVGRDMRISKERLKTARGGQKTQIVQKRIISKLDNLIKEKEDKMKSDADAAKAKEAKIIAGAASGQPLPDSITSSESGSGKVDEKKLKEIADKWGTMPEKERARAMMEITRDLPARYRVVIEEFFKSLSGK